jgi:hypothetical protein
MQIPNDEQLRAELERRGPPQDVTAGALFRKHCEVPAPSEVFDFPRRGVTDRVRMMVLRLEDHDDARLRAEEWLTKRPGISKEAREGKAAREVLADRIAREVIALSACSEKPIDGSDATGALRYVRWFAGPDDVGKLTPDEVNALFSSYVLTQHRYGMHPAFADEAEVTAWIQRLTEGASASPLSVCTFQELAELTCTLAKRAYSCCAILDSLRSNLPATLASQLESWGIGTDSRGWPAAALLVQPDLGSVTSKSDEVQAPVLSTIPAEPIGMDQALKFAKELRKD